MACTSKRCLGTALPGCLLTLTTFRAGSRSTSSDFTPASAPIHPSMSSSWPHKSKLPSPVPPSSSAFGLSQASSAAWPLLLPPALLPHFHNSELRAHSASRLRFGLCLQAQCLVPLAPFLAPTFVLGLRLPLSLCTAPGSPPCSLGPISQPTMEAHSGPLADLPNNPVRKG